MKKRTLLIDDLRNLEADMIARDPIEGIKCLQDKGPWDILLLDHDMATYEDGREITGYDVLLWIEERLYNLLMYLDSDKELNKLKMKSNAKNIVTELFQKSIPKEIKLVTDNASAREKMKLAIAKIESLKKELKKELSNYNS